MRESGYLLPISCGVLLDKAASQARLYWGSYFFLFHPQEENFIFFCIAEPRVLLMIKAENDSSWLLPLGYCEIQTSGILFAPEELMGRE